MQWRLPFLSQVLGGIGGRGRYNNIILLGVALFGSVGGILSFYVFFRRTQRDRRGIHQPPHNNTNINESTPSSTPSSTPTTETLIKPRQETKQRATNIPAFKDFTKRTVVTVATIGTVFEYSEGKKGKIIEKESKNMEVLRVLAGKADLYLITQCEAQDDFDSVHEALLSCGIFTAGLNPVKHLSCSTAIGKAHIARQLESKLHIDSDVEVVSHLQRFTPHLLLISDSNNNNNNDTNTTASSSKQSGDVSYGIAPSLHQQFIK